MWNTDQAHNEKRKNKSHSFKIKHTGNFPFQQTIGIEHRTMIWFSLDKCARPSTEMPLTVLQLDKSEVYLVNPNGRSQTRQVCSVLEIGKSLGTFEKSI